MYGFSACKFTEIFQLYLTGQAAVLQVLEFATL